MGGLFLRDVLGTSADFSERMSQVASTAGSRLNQSGPDGGIGADAHLAHLSVSPPLFTRRLEAA